LERLIRFLLSLFLSGLISLTGLGIVLYSLANFRWAHNALSAFEGEDRAMPELLLLITDSLSAAFQEPELLIQPPLLWLWLIFPGLLLFGYGIRRMVRRLIQGVPRSVLKPPETKAALWGSTLAYLLGVLICVPGIVNGLFHAHESIPHIFFGTETHAKTSNFRDSGRRTETGLKIFLADAVFEDSDGRTRETTIEVPNFMVAGLRRKPGVDLIYLDGASPMAHLKQYVTTPFAYLWFFLWRIALLYVAVCGLLRNFLPGRSAPPTATETIYPGKPAPPAGPDPRSAPRRPPPRPTGTGGRQTGFGRRGLS